MKRLLKVLVVLIVLGGGALFVLYPRLTALAVQSPYEAAEQLEEAMQQGTDTLTFREEDIRLDEVYAALESVYPYAFSLHSTTRANHTTELRVELSRPAQQKQAWEYAQSLAADTVTSDMDQTEKLRALHDVLVRLCVYDTETADGDRQSGATAPFAADGALLDHKAVCAGYGRAYVMLCKAVGIRAIYISSAEMDHGWNAVRQDGKTYFIDCTFDDPVPDRGEYVSNQYFMQDADTFAVTHTWDKPFYEQVLDHCM